MILSRRVSLGGIELDEIDPAVVIRGVDTGATRESFDTANRMGGAGQRITRRHWESLETAVTFAMDIRGNELARRRELFDKVCAWAAGGGWLTTTGQPGKRMHADRVVLPSAGDLRKWDSEYTILFTACGVPFWQEAEPIPMEIGSISRGSREMTVGGTVRTAADITARNISGQTINKLSIGVGGNTFSFTELGLGGSESLTISHGTDGLLRIRAGSQSVYHLRTPESADDLYAEPGTVTVTVDSQRAVALTVRAPGRWTS